MSNWEFSSFSDVIIDVTKNATKIKKEEYLSKGKYQIIDQGQTQIAGYTNNEVGIYTEVPAIIFGDHTRIIKYVDKPLFLGADGVKLLKTKKDNLDYKFLYYYFIKNEIPNTGYNRHFKWLKELSIPLIPLDIQKHIADTLGKTQELIDCYKKQFEELDNLVKATFYDMFGDPVANEKGWKSCKLGDICTIVRGASPRPIEKFLGGTIPWIKIGDATKGDDLYLTSTKECIIEEGIKKSRYIKSGSLIFANCGVSLGFARIITFNGCIHDGWLAIDINGYSIEKIFLLKQLNEKTEYFRRTAPSGTQPNLNTDIMRNEDIIIPPLALQERFTTIVLNIEQQKTIVKQSLTECQNLFNSLMSKYFD